jgi:hypothetical protein
MTTKVYVRKNGEAVIPSSVIKSWGFEPGMEFEIDIHIPSDGKHAKFSPDIPSDKTVQDFLDEYEQKYRMKSESFYEKYLRGKTEDDFEMNDWAGWYETKLALEEEKIDPRKTTLKHIKRFEFKRESINAK